MFGSGNDSSAPRTIEFSFRTKRSSVDRGEGGVCLKAFGASEQEVSVPSYHCFTVHETVHVWRQHIADLLQESRVFAQ